MAHEIDVDFQQDLPSYLNALKQYDIQYGPKSQNLQGLGSQNFQVRSNNFAPGYGYVNPQNNELFPLYPETGEFEQPNPGLPHSLAEEPPPPLAPRLNYWIPWGAGDHVPVPTDPRVLAGKPYYGPFRGNDEEMATAAPGRLRPYSSTEW